jgi:hypothetical protein
VLESGAVAQPSYRRLDGSQAVAGPGTPKGGNKPTQLLFGTSVFDVRLELPLADDIEVKNGLRVINLPAALIGCAPSYFAEHPDDLRAALSMIPDATDILRRLLGSGRSVVAGRLAGGFRNIGRDEIADRILRSMRTAGYMVHEDDPFNDTPAVTFTARETSPYVNRLKLLWASMRGPILQAFPAPPGIQKDAAIYLKQVDDLYTTDAYNSLSIEGYRGYWQAFQSVKKSLGSILSGENPGTVVSRDYDEWYGQLFGPSVTAGIVNPADLAGFRNAPSTSAVRCTFHPATRRCGN